MGRLNFNKKLALLSVILHCPMCSNRYNADQINIIDSKEPPLYDSHLESSVLLVHTECEQCKSSVVFKISLFGPEIYSVGMVTDLTSSDARKFREEKPLAIDEIIEFHGFLQKFDGDFQTVLK